MAWPLIAAAAASAISSILKNRSQNKAAQNQADLYNDWLKQYQNTAQGLMGQAQAAGWNPFGPQTSTSQSSTTGGSSYTKNPFITKDYKPLDELMRGIMTGRLQSGSSMPAGYESNRARAINESFAGADAAARNMAAKRGLSGEQSYAVASPVSRARAGELADMRGEIPLLERQMQNEDIGITQGLQAAFGTGERGTSSSWSNTSGSQTNPFTASDLSALMRVMVPPGPQQSGQTGNSVAGDAVGSVGSLLGYYGAMQGGGGGAGSSLMSLLGNQAAKQGGMGALQYQPYATQLRGY